MDIFNLNKHYRKYIDLRSGQRGQKTGGRDRIRTERTAQRRQTGGRAGVGVRQQTGFGAGGKSFGNSARAQFASDSRSTVANTGVFGHTRGRYQSKSSRHDV